MSKTSSTRWVLFRLRLSDLGSNVPDGGCSTLVSDGVALTDGDLSTSVSNSIYGGSSNVTFRIRIHYLNIHNKKFFDKIMTYKGRAEHLHSGAVVHSTSATSPTTSSRRPRTHYRRASTTTCSQLVSVTVCVSYSSHEKFFN